MDDGVARRLAWDAADLIEGAEALLWGVADPEAAEVDELPDPSTAVGGVVTWVRQRVLRFELSREEHLPELVLVRTTAQGGLARFVARRSAQVGTRLVCDPPQDMRVFDRRKNFRVPVATGIVVTAPPRRWSLDTMDCSLGGFRACLPAPLDLGTEVQVALELDAGIVVALSAVVRHCRPALSAPVGASPALATGGESGASITGFQFGEVHADAERRLSQFVGRHQRRLVPRVQAGVLVEYRSHGRAYFIEALASELSPGDIVLAVRENHMPGDHLDLKFRVGHQTFEFSARAVACYNSDEAIHVVRASLGDASDLVEGQFRKVVRDLAMEQASRS